MNNKYHINLNDEFEDTEQDEFLNSKNIDSEFNNDLLDHALHYAKLGYPIFPVHNIKLREGVAECSCG